MKKTKTTIIILIGLIFTYAIGILMYSRFASLKYTDYFIYTVVAFIVIIGLAGAIKKLKAEKKGLTTEDELIKKIKLKAAVHAFTASFYLWIFILLFTVNSSISNKVLLGISIIGMALVFLRFWFYYNKRGLTDEN